MLLVTQKVGSVPIATCLTHEMAYEITSAMGLKPGETTVTEIAHLVTLEEIAEIRLNRIIQSLTNEDDKEFLGKLLSPTAIVGVPKMTGSDRSPVKSVVCNWKRPPFAAMYKIHYGSNQTHWKVKLIHSASLAENVGVRSFKFVGAEDVVIDTEDFRRDAIEGELRFLYKYPLPNQVPVYLFVPTDLEGTLLRKGFYEMNQLEDVYTVNTAGGIKVYVESREKYEKDPPLCTGMQDDWVLLYEEE